MAATFRRSAFIALVSGVGAAVLPAAETPLNFLVIIGDDCSYSELPLFGGKNVSTPHVDRLAKEGVFFRRAYVGMSMCVPCRAELYTGLYPCRSGVCWNHSSTKTGTISIVQHLGRLGYRTGIAGKVHARPRSVYPFEMVDGFERNCVAKTASYDVAGIRTFMARDRSRPFCLVVGLVVPHVPWTVGDSSVFDRKKLVLPPHFADTPETRESFARYLAEIAYMDMQIGEVLKVLEEVGQADRTVVVFTSEQGGQWPGGKWTNWEQGLRTALIVRWPGRVKPGAQTDALVQYADVLPTLLDIAGGKPEALGFDGRSFLRVLTGASDRHRQFAYAMHNNIPEGPAYPIRSVTDGRFRYIRNLTPEALYIEKHLMGRAAHNPYWLSWMWASETDPHAYAMVRRYMRRPAEQLYDTVADPFELTDLAADPAHATRKAALAAELERWMSQQRDPGVPLDTREAFRRK